MDPVAPMVVTASTGYQGSRNNNSVLWMGDVDPDMNEDFILESFRLLKVTTTYVKVIRDRESGSPLGYAFIGFDDEQTAKSVLDRFNGTAIPNSSIGRKFKMNTAGKNHNHHSYHNRNQPRPRFHPDAGGGHAMPSSSYHYRSGVQHSNSNHNHLPQSNSTGPTTALEPSITIGNSCNNSTSGNSSGPVSGGSSKGNTPAPVVSVTVVDNWNPTEVSTSSSSTSTITNGQPRNSQERTGSSQESGSNSNSNRSIEYTAFIGSLDYAITSETLMDTFKRRYPSVSSGKVILEESTGQSKGFGFVRFGSQAEYKAALLECAGQSMFGGRGIRISEAHPKPPRSHYAGSIHSGDGPFGGGHSYHGTRASRGGHIGGVSNGHGVSSVGQKLAGHGSGKGYQAQPGDPTSSLTDMQKQRKDILDTVHQWYGKYPGDVPGRNQQQQQQSGHSGGQMQQQHQFQGSHRSDYVGMPITLPPEGGYGGYPFWTPYGQTLPAGYPDSIAVAGQPGTPSTAYWSTGTGPNGQATIFALDPSQMYQAAAFDYSQLTGPGPVASPYPQIPFTAENAHMFAPQAMMHQQQQLLQQQGHPPNVSGSHHRFIGSVNGAGGDAVMPGGPTPPSDTEPQQHGGIVIPITGGNGGWPQN